MATKD